jgi:hypothetical protein
MGSEPKLANHASGSWRELRHLGRPSGYRESDATMSNFQGCFVGSLPAKSINRVRALACRNWSSKTVRSG